MKRLIVLPLFCAALASPQEVPAHWRDLKYGPLVYTPPRAADYRHKLASGAVAFLVEDHDFPLINISILVRAGEYLDPAGKTGLANLAGSQIRSGGTKTKPPAAFDEEAAFLAANISSNIGPLEGNAGLNCLSKDIDAGLALFMDMLRNPGFAEDRFKLAKSQTLQALERRNDNAAGIESREFERLLRGDRHFSTTPVTKASLDAITRQDLIDFNSRYYYPANFILAVSGDFQTSDMLARLEKAFSGWPNRAGAPPPVPRPDYTPKPGVYLVDKKDVNQGRVRMGHLGTMMTNPDHLAITIMNGILGGSSFSSRITQHVRVSEGLAYSAGSMFNHGNFYDGTFTAFFQSKSSTVAQAVAIVKEEVERIRATKVSPEELQAEVNRTAESFPRRFSTASIKASQFAQDTYTRLPEDYWQKYRERIRALTPADIQRVAQKYLHPDQMVILIVGDADAILKGNPDKPQFKLPAGIRRIPLPDPLTMVYPK